LTYRTFDRIHDAFQRWWDRLPPRALPFAVAILLLWLLSMMAALLVCAPFIRDE
jgi:hypothetical protein